MKKQLEPFFLANILLYFDSTQTIKQFELINKKCQEAIKIIKVNQLYQYIEENQEKKLKQTTNVSINEIQQEYKRLQSLDEELKIFSNIQTIRGNAKTLQQRKEYLDEFKRIWIDNCIVDNHYFPFEEYKHKITKLNITIKSSLIIDFSQFKRLRRITLHQHNRHFNPFQFFTDRDHRFEFIRINTLVNIESFINELHEYTIERFVLETQQQRINRYIQQCENVKKMSSIVFICNGWTGDKNIILPSSYQFLYSHFNPSIEEGMKLYHPVSIELSSFSTSNDQPIDLTHHKQLLQIFQQYQTSQQYIFPSSLVSYCGNSMKSLTTEMKWLRVLTLNDIQEMIYIPETIINLKLINCPQWKVSDSNSIQQLTLEKHQQTNPSVLQLKHLRQLICISQCLDINLVSLESIIKMKFISCSLKSEFQFPLHLKSLSCSKCISEIHYSFPQTIENITIVECQQLFSFDDSIKQYHLKEWTSDYQTFTLYQSSQFITSLQTLCIRNIPKDTTINCSSYSTVETFGIFNSQSIHLILPTQLKELYCVSSPSMIIENWKECLIERIIFKECKSINWNCLPYSLRLLFVSPVMEMKMNKELFPLLEFHEMLIETNEIDQERNHLERNTNANQHQNNFNHLQQVASRSRFPIQFTN